MKHLLFGILLLSQLSFGQEIIGGKGDGNGSTFTFKVTQVVTVNGDYSYLKTNKNSYDSNYLYCDHSNKMFNYVNSVGVSTHFIFDSLDKCKVVLACVNKLDKSDTNNSITVEIDRETKKVSSVTIPDFCDKAYDPYSEYSSQF